MVNKQAVLEEKRKPFTEVLDILSKKERPFEACKAMADEYVLKADLDAARQLYQDFIACFPENSDAYRELGVVQERLEDFDEQARSYQRAIALSEEQPHWLYVSLARYLSKRKKKTEAIELYRLGLERDANGVDGLSYAELARLLSEQGDVEAALVNYQKAIELQPELKWIIFCIETLHYNQGVKQLVAGEIELAESYFSQVNQIKPSWEAPIWFKKTGKHWPRYRFDCLDKFEALKPPDIGWPRISIVTPSFNQGNFVEETILSVLNQQYENVEYILIDGGSTDQTQSVLTRYQDKMSIVLATSDTGQSDAINKGFRLATGELLGWLNSDDMLAPGALYNIGLSYLKSRCDIVAGMCIAHQNFYTEMVRKPNVRQATFTASNLVDLQQWQTGKFFFQPEVFFSRRIWESCGSYLDQKLHYAMDHELWLRFADTKAKLSVINWPIALFRKHINQKTSDNTSSLLELSTVIQVHMRDTDNRRQKVENEMLVSYIDEVQGLISTKAYKEALHLAEKAIKDYPNSSDLHRLQGVAYEGIGKFDAVIQKYQKAINISPEQPVWVYLVLGQLLSQRGHTAGAKEIYEKAIELFPENAEAYKLLGIEQEKLCEHTAEIASYKRAIELDPDQPLWVYSTLTILIVAENCGSPESLHEAISICESAVSTLSVEPSWIASVYRDLGQLLNQLGKLEESVKCYRRSVQVDADYLNYQALGDALFAINSYSEAINSYKHAITVNSDCFWSHYNLGKAFFKVDNFEQSAAFFEIAYTINKDLFDCYELAAVACEFAELKEQAVKYWRALLKKKEGSSLSLLFDDLRKELRQKEELLSSQSSQLPKNIQNEHSSDFQEEGDASRKEDNPGLKETDEINKRMSSIERLIENFEYHLAALEMQSLEILIYSEEKYETMRPDCIVHIEKLRNRLFLELGQN